MTRLGLATRGDNRLSPDDVAWAVDKGVRYLNWCGHDDGLSRFVRESRTTRRELVVAVQLKARTRDEAQRELDFVFESLGGPPDILTLYYVESEDEWLQITAENGVWDALAARRRAGELALIGMTTHQRPLAARWVRERSPEGERRLDLLMIRYNAAHRGAEREVFPVSARIGIPVVCFTGLRWGALLRAPTCGQASVDPPTPRECYRFCLSNPSAGVVLTAPKVRPEMEEGLALLDDWRAMDEREMSRIQAHGDRVRASAGEFW